MFDNISEKFNKVIKNVRGYGKITEDNISDILRTVRIALLESDVNYKVVKEFIERVKEKALGSEVMKSLKPSEVFLKILKDELIELLENENTDLYVSSFSVLMLVGLQGSGKTTTIGKLGNLIRKKYNKKPMFIACDIYRPAAIDQLQQIGKQLDIYVYTENLKDPSLIAVNGINYARENGYDYVLIDTAGRLHIDEVLMSELQSIKSKVNPNEILLVIDSMIGQDSVNVINGFNDSLNITGSILTKMDSDTKGGVALSLKHLTKVPIKFIGTGEKLDGISEFDPNRIVSRILGEGDLVGLIEKAEDVIDKEETKKLNKDFNRFDFNDFLISLKQIKKLGSIENILKMIPGGNKLGNVNIDSKELVKIEAIISSMTLKERKNPSILKASRKIRIANGSGTKVEDINRLLKQFEQMKQMMKVMKNKF